MKNSFLAAKVILTVFTISLFSCGQHLKNNNSEQSERFLNHANDQLNSPMSFATYCKDSQASHAVKLVVSELLIEAKTNDCDVAESILKTKGKFWFNMFSFDVEIDLSPLASLESIETFGIFNARIINLEAVIGLPKLKMLNLTENNLDDISALVKAKNIEELWIRHNKVQDLTPLSNLSTLKILDLDANEISDVKSLSGLLGLTELSLVNNRLSDVSNLATLKKLYKLDLQNNPNLSHRCPVQPEAVCKF